MSTIRDLSRQAMVAPIRQPATIWRDSLLPANFDGFPFHVEAAVRESGRRIALHQFPKKELPYAEDMGHEAISFTVRGYIIVYPHDDVTTAPGSLYQRDYRNARDRLQDRLDKGGAGVLQLPTFYKYPTNVVCMRYRLTEEERFGGYCVFDMTFVEKGVRPFAEHIDAESDLRSKTYALREQVRQVWAREADKGQKQIMGPFNPLKRFVGPPTKMRRYNPLQRMGKPPYAPITQTVTSPPSMRQGRPGGHDEF